LRFTPSTQEGVEKSDVIFIAVPTPPLDDGGVDLSFIEGVSREIAGAMTAYKIVVDKSTVPVKTGEKVAETIKRYCKARVDFDVVSNPEFLREGFAVDDFMKPDRVVVGVLSSRPVAAMKEIYAPYKAPVIVTDINSAELIKHAANSFLALKISYINAVSVIVRNVRGQRAGSGAGDGDGRAHRAQISGRFAGFWRQLFSQGFERVYPHFGIDGLRLRVAQGSAEDQR
jgi:UDPglucose 6-dehydrogenase